MDEIITYNDIREDVDAVATKVIPFCRTDTDGIEDWLSAAATDWQGTVGLLAEQWDELNTRS